LRLQIVFEEIDPKKLVTLQDKELASDELQQRIKDITNEHFQAERTDAVIADQMKRGTKSEHQCRKCKKFNVSMYAMQTRGADEPMTEFYNCRDCGYGWRICP
jgi:DNA-directed RNA polymerase subunit M/transcription elongation factor TFIIS